MSSAERKDIEDHRTVVLGFHYWGSGVDLEQAKRNFRNAGGSLSDGYAVYTFDNESTFDGVDWRGDILYRGNAPTRTMKYGKRLKKQQQS